MSVDRVACDVSNWSFNRGMKRTASQKLYDTLQQVSHCERVDEERERVSETQRLEAHVYMRTRASSI